MANEIVLPGANYTALPATVVLSAGTTSSTVTFTAANDSRVERGEIVQLTLGSSDRAVMILPSSSVAITDTTSELSLKILTYCNIYPSYPSLSPSLSPSPLPLSHQLPLSDSLSSCTA